MESAHQWVPELEAAELLAVGKTTLRAMRRDGRLSPGVHYVFATGTAGGPVTYDITAIRERLAQLTVEMVEQEAERREEEQQARQEKIETYDAAGATQS